jgi:hypothetical protein
MKSLKVVLKMSSLQQRFSTGASWTSGVPQVVSKIFASRVDSIPFLSILFLDCCEF